MKSVIKVCIYTLSQHDPVLFHERPRAQINKQKHYQVCWLVHQENESEPTYKECNTLYRMAHMQIKPKWQEVFEKSSCHNLSVFFKIVYLE